MVKRLVDDETRDAVITDYNKGVKVLDIESKHGVSRATLYWILQEAGVSPTRTQKGVRLRGNTEDLSMLYEIIQVQGAAIARQLESFEKIVAALKAGDVKSALALGQAELDTE